MTPERLHQLYLEAIKGLSKESFNPNAAQPYSALTDEQKSIDRYISNQINEAIVEAITAERARLREALPTYNHQRDGRNVDHDKDEHWGCLDCLEDGLQNKAMGDVNALLTDKE